MIRMRVHTPGMRYTPSLWQQQAWPTSSPLQFSMARSPGAPSARRRAFHGLGAREVEAAALAAGSCRRAIRGTPARSGSRASSPSIARRGGGGLRGHGRVHRRGAGPPRRRDYPRRRSRYLRGEQPESPDCSRPSRTWGGPRSRRRRGGSAPSTPRSSRRPVRLRLDARNADTVLVGVDAVADGLDAIPARLELAAGVRPPRHTIRPRERRRLVRPGSDPGSGLLRSFARSTQASSPRGEPSKSSGIPPLRPPSRRASRWPRSASCSWGFRPRSAAAFFASTFSR